MALVQLTDRFSQLSDWAGRLFEVNENATIAVKTATAFSFSYNAGAAFAGYTMTVKGSGFAYDGATPIAGTLKSLSIFDAGGLLVLKVSGIAAGSLASDLPLFASRLFGWLDANGNFNNTDPNVAWSQLLSGDDTINGTAGGDYQFIPGFNAGNDVFNMGDGDDWVQGGMGHDTIDGGDGWDGLSFRETSFVLGAGMVQGVVANLATGIIQDPFGDTDQITSIEIIEGSTFADRIIGGDAVELFRGLRGNDTLEGGSNLSDHGDGGNWAQYFEDRWDGGGRGILADLEVSWVGGNIIGSIQDGFGTIDRTVNMQSVQGTFFNDVFIGSSQQNVFSGGEGVDRYDGADGSDTLWFFQNFGNNGPHGVTVDLSLRRNQVIDDGFGNRENAVSIENIVGSESEDMIKGNAGGNVIEGRGGADTMTGGGGRDDFKFYWENDLSQRDQITDFKAGSGAGHDQIQVFISTWGFDTTLHLVNGTQSQDAAATFLFDAGSHILSFDRDGTGDGAAVQMALLTGVTALTAANFDLL